MHAALHLAPVLAAEKSHTPFYVAGGVLVAWALIVSIGLGLRRPDFPGDLRGQRVVMGITATLVLATIATAVITASPPGKTEEAARAAQKTQPSAPATQTATTPAPAATGTSPAPPAPAHAETLNLAANANGLLSFDTKKLTAHAGTVTILFANASPLEHNVTIAQGSNVVGATPTFAGGSRTLTVKLAPGTYTFYCSVPGHRQSGMEGTLTVQ